jgi:hypothetical protein
MKQNVRGVAVALGLAAVVGAGVFVVTGRNSASSVLPNSGATLVRVSDEAPQDRTLDLSGSLVRPTASPEGGFVLRLGAKGGWWPDRVTPPNNPLAGNEYVTAATECPGALIAAGATVAPGTDMDAVEPAPDAVAAVWRNGGGTAWKQVPLSEMPAHSVITGIASGKRFGQPDVLVASARTLTTASDAFALVSADCGQTWRSSELPLGSTGGFEYAAAVTASDAGFVMVGSVDGAHDETRGAIVWRSRDGQSWEPTVDPSASFMSYSPKAVAAFGDQVLVTGDPGASASDNRLFEWSGGRDRWFEATTILRDADYPIGASALPGGAYVLQGLLESGDLFLLRRLGDPLADKLPGLNTKNYASLQLLSDGSQMWIVGQRRETAQLETWSLTLRDTETVALN